MRVLILTTQYLPHIGGSELAIYNLTKRLPDVEFKIITGWKWFLPVSGFLRGLRRDYDLIHVFQASYAGGAGVLLKLFRPRVPLIVTLQEGKDLAKQNFFVQFFRKIILKKADVITAISNYLLEYGKKINPKAKAYLLPNGVGISPRPSLIDKRGSIVTVSRLVPKNGIDVLIRAMVLLQDRHLEILGDGPLRHQLEQLAKSLGVADRVAFLGSVAPEAIPDRLARASVFVRPSRSEGLGSAFLEAMAAGVPIVATPVGGIPDFLKDRETGLFCNVDDPQSVADAITTLLTDHALCEKITKQAYQMVTERYDWDILAKQYYEIICRHSRI